MRAQSTSTITIGETNVSSTPDNGNGNRLAAQNATLSEPATIKSLSFYVTQASGKLILGIYDASGPNGGPGALKGRTNSFTPIIGWNTANVITPVLLPAGTYWLAYLPSSNRLAFVKGLTSGVISRYYSYKFGALPATFSKLPSSNPYHSPFYARLNPAPTISSVSLSNRSFTASVPSGTVVGTISVTMSSGSFTGSLSLSGPNASDFQIVGSNLETNGVLPAGSYSINIVAAESGAANSPFTQSETITGVSPSISSISLSNSSFVGGSPSGTVVGTIGVTTSSASFTGSLSLSGTNSSNFQIVDSNLETNGVLGAGSYSINIVATESGIPNSPYTQAETITGSSQSIASVSLSNNSFTGGSSSGTVVGAINVTMSPASPSFSGSLSLSTTQGGCTATNGANNSSFAISGSNLITSGTVAPGTYAVCILATQASASNSPVGQAETLDPPSPYPLKISSGVLVNQQNQPYMMIGDSPQGSVINIPAAQVTPGDATFETYLKDRKQEGFNTLWISALCEAYTACNNGGANDNATDINGNAPFAMTTGSQLSGTFTNVTTNGHGNVTCPETTVVNTACYDFSTASGQTPYWTHMDSIISQATSAGMLILFNVLPTDACNSPTSWLQALYDNYTAAPSKIDSYASFLVGRYASPNIIWMLGNDYNAAGCGASTDTDVDAALYRLATDIQSDDTMHRLITAEMDPTPLSNTKHTWTSVLSLNGYAYGGPTYNGALQAYSQNNTTIVPFQIEANYQGEDDNQDDLTNTISGCTNSPDAIDHNTRHCPLRERHMFWWAMLAGARAGFMDGNNFTWTMTPTSGWNNTGSTVCGGSYTNLDTLGNCEIIAGTSFLKNYAYKLVPDGTYNGGSAGQIASPFVTACYGGAAGTSCTNTYAGVGNVGVGNSATAAASPSASPNYDWISSALANDGSAAFVYMPGMTNTGTIASSGAQAVTVNMSLVNGGSNLTVAWYDPTSTMTSPYSTICSPTGTACGSGSQTFTTPAGVTHTSDGTSPGADWVLAVTSSGGGTPTASLTANPTTITSGNSSTLTWSSTNASSCTGTNFSTGNATSGSTSVSPTTTTTYTVNCSTTSANTTVTVTTAEEEFVGPLGGWINAQTTCGATGNGTTDDTSALQTCLNSLSASAPVVWLPCGTYLISSTLSIGTLSTGVQFASLIGASPSCVTLKWSTSAGANPMLNASTNFGKINRITFNGQNVASIGLQIPGSATFFMTGDEATDDVFENMQNGVACGNFGNGCSELTLLRDTFSNTTSAAAGEYNQNAIDLWVWYSLFQNNVAAVSVAPSGASGAGGTFGIYGNVFLNSSNYDAVIEPPVPYVALFNYSNGSSRFFTGGVGSPGPSIVVGNTVIQGSGTNPTMLIQNQGPGIILNNNIVTGSGAPVAPVASVSSFGFGDIFSMNNQFTTGSVATPCGSGAPVQAATRCHEIGDTIASASTIENAHPQPTLPSTPPNNSRKIYEVGRSCDADETNCTGSFSTIQAAINQAHTDGTTNPVVHIPAGSYTISSSISVPANFPIQIIGDGPNTILNAQSGTIRVMLVNGPSKATLRDFAISLVNGVDGVDVTGADQTGGRIFMEQPVIQWANTNLYVNGISNTTVELHNTQLQYSAVVGQTGMSVTGPGLVNLFSGATAGNYTDYTVSGTGNLEVIGVWHDSGSNATCRFANVTGSGSFTYAGSALFMASQPPGCTLPSVAISNFTGTANLSGLTFQEGVLGTDQVGISGIASGGNILGEGIVSRTGDTAWVDSTSPADSSAYLNGVSYNIGAAVDLTESCVTVTCPPTAAFLNPIVNRLATTQPTLRVTTGTGVEDLGLYHVSISMGGGASTNTSNGIQITP